MAVHPRKVIISCAVTGSVHTPTMSEHLALTPCEAGEIGRGPRRAGWTGERGDAAGGAAGRLAPGAPRRPRGYAAALRAGGAGG